MADVAQENAAGGTVVPRDPVGLDPSLERLGAQVLGAGPDVRRSADPVLQATGAGLSNHGGVEAHSGHDRETLAVQPTNVDGRRWPCSPTATARSRSSGIPRLAAKRLAVPAGKTAMGTARPARPSAQR